ncbi:hypothetical protein QVA66_10310 [Staphylococcus chromogenes]|nr:hypothetical protein [Staphylococcus chromogenes]
MQHWEPNPTWRRTHGKYRTYSVDLEAPALNEATWSGLLANHSEFQGGIDLGGVTLQRISPQVVRCASSGEDAFDSMAYAINEVFLPALTSTSGVRVVSEQRR